MGRAPQAGPSERGRAVPGATGPSPEASAVHEAGAGSLPLAHTGTPTPAPDPFPHGGPSRSVSQDAGWHAPRGGPWRPQTSCGYRLGALDIVGPPGHSVLVQGPLSTLVAPLPAGGFRGGGAGRGTSRKGFPRWASPPGCQKPQGNLGKDRGHGGDRGEPGPALLQGLAVRRGPLRALGWPVQSQGAEPAACWRGGAGAGRPCPLPRALRPDHLGIMRSRWPLVSCDPHWLQGPPPAREQLMTTRGCGVNNQTPFAVRAVWLTLRPAGGQRAGASSSLGRTGLSAMSPSAHPAPSCHVGPWGGQRTLLSLTAASCPAALQG